MYAFCRVKIRTGVFSSDSVLLQPDISARGSEMRFVLTAVRQSVAAVGMRNEKEKQKRTHLQRPFCRICFGQSSI